MKLKLQGASSRVCLLVIIRSIYDSVDIYADITSCWFCFCAYFPALDCTTDALGAKRFYWTLPNFSTHFVLYIIWDSVRVMCLQKFGRFTSGWLFQQYRSIVFLFDVNIFPRSWFQYCLFIFYHGTPLHIFCIFNEVLAFSENLPVITGPCGKHNILVYFRCMPTATTQRDSICCVRPCFLQRLLW